MRQRPRKHPDLDQQLLAEIRKLAAEPILTASVREALEKKRLPVK